LNWTAQALLLPNARVLKRFSWTSTLPAASL